MRQKDDFRGKMQPPQNPCEYAAKEYQMQTGNHGDMRNSCRTKRSGSLLGEHLLITEEHRTEQPCIRFRHCRENLPGDPLPVGMEQTQQRKIRRRLLSGQFSIVKPQIFAHSRLILRRMIPVIRPDARQFAADRDTCADLQRRCLRTGIPVNRHAVSVQRSTQRIDRPVMRLCPDIGYFAGTDNSFAVERKQRLPDSGIIMQPDRCTKHGAEDQKQLLLPFQTEHHDHPGSQQQQTDAIIRQKSRQQTCGPCKRKAFHAAKTGSAAGSFHILRKHRNSRRSIRLPRFSVLHTPCSADQPIFCPAIR